jgi:hypothetical protein
VYIGYGSDCTVFNPKFDASFNQYLEEINVEVEKYGQRYEK